MVKWYDENTLVIKTKDIERVKKFLAAFGLDFVEEQHDDGPLHYSTTALCGKVLEIYPK
jgi:hypothetical protein